MANDHSPFVTESDVALGLVFGGREVFTRSVFLSFDRAHGLAVNEQYVISRAAVGGLFAHGDARACRQAALFHILNRTGILRLQKSPEQVRTLVLWW